MKLDVEGFEEQVLNGAGELFQQHPPKAVAFEAECDAQGRIVSPNLLAFFRNYGFRIDHIPRPKSKIEPRENYLAWR